MTVKGLVAVGVLVLGVSGLAFALFLQGPALDPGLRTRLEGAGRVALLVPDVTERDELLQLALPGTDFARVPELTEALEGSDASALRRAMEEHRVASLLVASAGRGEGEAEHLRQALSEYRHVPGMRAVHLTPGYALYEPSLVAELGEDADVLLPRIARAILQGHEPPSVTRLPEPLRRIRSVEVMVLLRDRGRARLWRSARGSSVGRALITAAVVARQRWHERGRALGGELELRLPHLDVEVTLLEEDGTLGVTAPAFVERVFYEPHGVAYESPGAWRYQLPDATRRAGQGSAVRAYQALFRDNALPDDSLRRADLRFYRLVTAPVGVSRAPLSVDGLEPDEVLDVADGPPK